ncbi:hypothetical protein GGS24DRAFT_486860 [Hypoxylon argillaceum]|nr:hypothetical protein GGS24DRAFT_486860 [Hypoxylon argillaceum]
MASINAKPTLKVNTNHHQMPPPSVASATPATENPRPILKLNTSSRQSSFSGDAVPTPSTEKKIKIKINSQPGTPLPTPAHIPSAMKTKAGRTSKPTAKLTESKKRGYDSDEDTPLSVARSDGRPQKAIKITGKSTSKTKPNPTTRTVNTPVSAIRLKSKGEQITHRPGDAYDSEASDREADPQRESNFILRVMDGEPAEYLKKALSEGTIGQLKTNGGADFSVQFIDSEERRAMVIINGISYVAVLVQLPTITEAMKTWDRKNMMKNSDITEMLLCFAVVNSEDEAKAVPLPPMVTKNDLRWPHGITPPMHDAPNRRFRKTLSEKQWERTQNSVTKLLEDDAAAEEVRTEIIMEDDGYPDYDEDEDAEGELEPDDYFGDQTQDMDVDAPAEPEEEDLLREFLADDEELGGATPATQQEAPTPITMGANTPMPLQEEQISEEEEEDEDVSDEDDEDDEEGDDDDSGRDRERKQQLSELHELQKQLQEAEKKLATTTMPILKKRISTGIESIKKEINVKKAALGITEED